MRIIIDYKKIKTSECNDLLFFDTMFMRCKVIEHDGDEYTIIFVVVPDHHVITVRGSGRTEIGRSTLNTMAFIVKHDIMNMLEDAIERLSYFKISNFPFSGITNLGESEIFGENPTGIQRLIDAYDEIIKKMEEE